MKPLDLPNDATGDALRRLVEDGSDLAEPMDVDFHVAVPDRGAGAQVAIIAEKLGFQAEVIKDEESGEWVCSCTKRIVATHEAVTTIEQQMDLISRPFGGYADGWGTFGNADDA